MVKERHFSVEDDFHTGLLSKILFFVGIFLLIIFIFLKISSYLIRSESSGFVGQIYDFSQSTYPGTILAFSIIFLGVSGILYFFHYQFAKLAKIADEIENEEDSEILDEK